MKIVAWILIIAFSITIIGGCGGGTGEHSTNVVANPSPSQPNPSPSAPSPSDNQLIRVIVTESSSSSSSSSESDSFSFVMADGTTGDIDSLVPLFAGPNPESFEKEIDFETLSPEATTQASIGKYWFSLYTDRHNLGFCINVNNVWHLNFKLKDKNTNWVICDIHIPIWRNGGDWGGGVLITRGPDGQTNKVYCKTFRKATHQAIKDALREGLRSLNMAYIYASAVAATMAAVVVQFWRVYGVYLMYI